MKVLMIGPGRNVKGGISTVVNQYYAAGLDKKVELKYIPTMEDGSKPKKLLTAINAYIEFCHCVKAYDVVHVHMSARASFYRKSHFIKKAHTLGKKIIIHMHGSEFDVFYAKECDRHAKKYVRTIFEMADVVIALSKEWKEKLSTFCDPNKICIIYNAVTMPDFYRTEYGDKNILFLGRLGRRKGVYDLLNVIPKVLEIIPNAHFYFGGDGDIEDFQRIIVERGLSTNVSYIGWVTGAKKDLILKKCSVFVLPSYHEGMPMSLLEAMSYGCAVISTNVGGIPQIIDQGVNGYRVNAGDLSELEKILVQVIANPEEKERLGHAARNCIEENFNLRKNVEILYRLYQMRTKITSSSI